MRITIPVIIQPLTMLRQHLELCGLRAIGIWMAGIGASMKAIGSIRPIMALGIIMDIGATTTTNGITANGGSGGSTLDALSVRTRALP